MRKRGSGLTGRGKRSEIRRGRYGISPLVFGAPFRQKAVVAFLVCLSGLLFLVYVSVLVRSVSTWLAGGDGQPERLGRNATSPREYSTSISSVGGVGGGGSRPERMSLEEAKMHKLGELGGIDYERYTIRMNTWRRNEQLLISLNHHSRCEGVAQIQVVWCDDENDPPPGVEDHPSGKVVVERHATNSLNERFNILLPTPTMGILSMDDDVLRPCEAIDSGFFRWTRSPERIVGYDARVHVENATTATWSYGPLSVTKRKNAYSMTLPRFCFIHRDYLDLYIEALPMPILDAVRTRFNCEDIAMSFLVSLLTGGKPPLLANRWAMQTQIKLYHIAAISDNSARHNAIRHSCVDEFAQRLGLKADPTRLQIAALPPQDSNWKVVPYSDEMGDGSNEGRLVKRERALRKEWDRSDPLELVTKWILIARSEAKKQGLIQKTPEWEGRWKKRRTSN